MSSTTVGLLTSYAEKTRWTPTQASRDANRKAFQDSSWADVCLLRSSSRTELISVVGASRYRRRLCYVQSYDSRFCPLHCSACGRRKRRIPVDAKTYPSTRWPRSCLGCLLHYTLRFCQFAQAYQISQAGQHRNSAVQPCR